MDFGKYLCPIQGSLNWGINECVNRDYPITLGAKKLWANIIRKEGEDYAL